MRKSALSFAIVSALALSACATPPASYNVVNNRVVPESKDVVWERVVSFFATNNLSIKTIEKDSGIIAAERMISSPTTSGGILGWADCGVNAMAPARSQGIDLNVFVRPQGQATQITVNTRFNEVRFNTLTSMVEDVPCNSTGLLEERILNIASGQPDLP